jgi:hypothetical protein
MTSSTREVVSLYWSMGGAIPFWFPVGLVGTNFQPIESGSGVPIAALPAGLAFGIKFELGRGFFLGASAFCNWSIQPQTGGAAHALPYPGKGENVVPSPTRGGGSGHFATGDTGNTITLKALAAGGLVDVGGYLLLGAAATVDFTRKEPAVTPIFVVGVGQRFLEFLSGDRQPSRRNHTKSEEQ